MRRAAKEHIDFVQDTTDWLATLGRVDDADSQIEVIGIKQRLAHILDPRNESNPDYVGRLMSECNRFRHDFEMRRKVMPLALKGESRSRDAAKGGSTIRKT